MADRTILVTSIKLDNIENQRLAIESWLRLGFSVSSLNTLSDVEKLRPQFKDVDFFAVQENIQTEHGKSSIGMMDVIAFLGQHGSSVCGLINPDVYWRATPAATQFLLEEAKNSMVLAHRTEAGSLDDVTGDICKLGFDVFLFDKAVLGILPASEFRFGQPWWDYWLASCLILPPRRFPLKFASFPFAFRVKGNTSSSDEASHAKYGMHFAKFLDQGTYDALLKQPPAALRSSLETLSLNVAMGILFECQWVSCFPE